MAVPCGARPATWSRASSSATSEGRSPGRIAKVGKFGRSGRNLLLDEIDTLGLEQQAKLLRVIETGEFEPVGSNETQVCTARIVAASNCRSGSRRLARASSGRICITGSTSCRSTCRRCANGCSDIAPLGRMAARFAFKFKKNLTDISRDAMAVLESFPWPGNIRQLENVVQQSVLISTGVTLEISHLPIAVQEAHLNRTFHSRGVVGSLTQHREARERTVIEQAIVTHEYSRARAGHALGISRVTLYKKMRKYGLLDMPRHSGDGHVLGLDS